MGEKENPLEIKCGHTFCLHCIALYHVKNLKYHDGNVIGYDSEDEPIYDDSIPYERCSQCPLCRTYLLESENENLEEYVNGYKDVVKSNINLAWNCFEVGFEIGLERMKKVAQLHYFHSNISLKRIENELFIPLHGDGRICEIDYFLNYLGCGDGVKKFVKNSLLFRDLKLNVVRVYEAWILEQKPNRKLYYALCDCFARLKMNREVIIWAQKSFFKFKSYNGFKMILKYGNEEEVSMFIRNAWENGLLCDFLLLKLIFDLKEKEWDRVVYFTLYYTFSVKACKNKNCCSGHYKKRIKEYANEFMKMSQLLLI